MQIEKNTNNMFYLRRPNDRYFKPEDYMVTYIEKDQYGVYEKQHLPYEVRLAWFWDVFPEGQICFEGEPVSIKEGVYTSTVHLFSDQESKKRGYSLASAKACKTVTGEDVDGNIAMALQSQAIANALKRAGFIVLFPARRIDQEEILAEIESEKMLYISSDDGKIDNQTPQKELEQGLKQSAETTEKEKLENAMNMICQIGSKKGKTLKEIAMEDPSYIAWLANRADQFPDLQNAAKVIFAAASNK